MLFWQPLVNRRRQKEPGLAVDRPEVAHRGKILEKRSKPASILSGPPHGVNSDRLLVMCARRTLTYVARLDRQECRVLPSYIRQRLFGSPQEESDYLSCASQMVWKPHSGSSTTCFTTLKPFSSSKAWYSAPSKLAWYRGSL